MRGGGPTLSQIEVKLQSPTGLLSICILERLQHTWQVKMILTIKYNQRPYIRETMH